MYGPLARPPMAPVLSPLVLSLESAPALHVRPAQLRWSRFVFGSARWPVRRSTSPRGGRVEPPWITLEFGGFGFPSSSSLAQSALTFKHQRARALSLSTLGARRSIRFFFFSVSVIHISISTVKLLSFIFSFFCWALADVGLSSFQINDLVLSMNPILPPPPMPV